MRNGRQDQNHHGISDESIGDDCRCEVNRDGAEYMSRSSEVVANRVKLRPTESENGIANEGPSGSQLGSGAGKSGSNAMVRLDGVIEGSSGSIRGRNGLLVRKSGSVVAGGRLLRMESCEHSSDRIKSPKGVGKVADADGSTGWWHGCSGRGLVRMHNQREAETPSS